jgi:hypothetical protein
MHHIIVDGLNVWCGDQWLEDFDQAMKQYYKENMTKQNINFGQAIEAAKQGKRVARAGWNGKGMYLQLQTVDEHSKMQHNYLYMSDVNGKFFPWNPNNLDILAEDWTILD